MPSKFREKVIFNLLPYIQSDAVLITRELKTSRDIQRSQKKFFFSWAMPGRCALPK